MGERKPDITYGPGHDFGPWLEPESVFGTADAPRERRCRRCGAREWREATGMTTYGDARSEGPCRPA